MSEPREPGSYLGNCVDRTRAQGSAAVRVTTSMKVPDMDQPPTEAAHGHVDFAGDRWRLGLDPGSGWQDLFVADGRLLYECHTPDSRWTRRRLRQERYILYDPRGRLELLATGCRSARATGPGTYQVRYEPARVTECTRPRPAPEWTSFTGAVTVDDEHRVTMVSIRLADESGDAHVETVVGFSDFGTPVRTEPPDDDHVTEYDDYIKELFGDPLPEGLTLDEDHLT